MEKYKENGIFESVKFLVESDQDKEEINIELESKGGDFYNILNNGKKVGKVGLSIYEDIKAVGIGSLEIDASLRGSGLGTAAIKHIVKSYKDNYDLIYCYVDPKNIGAIKLYKRLGKVYDDTVNEDGYHYVVFYKKSKKKWGS